jgi:hypothetical protein
MSAPSGTVRRRAAAIAAAAVACLLPTVADSAQKVDITAHARLVPGGGATLIQDGTFSGSPLGRGTVRLRTRLGQGNGATFNFVMRTSRGSVRGSGDIALQFSRTAVSYHGTARITGGDGAFRGMRASGLRIWGRGGLTAKAYGFHLTGSVG